MAVACGIPPADQGCPAQDAVQQDPSRGERLTAEAAGRYLDYSKHRVTDETLRLLLDLAAKSSLRQRIDAMFHREKINITENRAVLVLHVALRAPRNERVFVDGHDVVSDVHAVLVKMSDFARRVSGGEWHGHTGKRIRNVVNLVTDAALVYIENSWRESSTTCAGALPCYNITPAWQWKYGT